MTGKRGDGVPIDVPIDAQGVTVDVDLVTATAHVQQEAVAPRRGRHVQGPPGVAGKTQGVEQVGAARRRVVDRRRRLAPIANPLVGQIDIEAVRGPPAQFEAPGKQLVCAHPAPIAAAGGAAQRIVHTQIAHRPEARAVAVETVRLAAHRGHAQGRAGADSEVAHGARFSGVEARQPPLHAEAVGAEFRAPGVHRDRPARGVFAEQRSLRAAQDLDAVDVQHFDIGGLDMRDHKVIHDHAHLILEVQNDAVLAHPADGKVGRLKPRLLAIDNIGRINQRIAQVSRNRARDIRLGHRRHRDRGGLDIGLRAPGRGHHHLLELLGQGRRGAGRQRRGGDPAQGAVNPGAWTARSLPPVPWQAVLLKQESVAIKRRGL